eukprot:COSAG02_NODE_4155_length_5706_cov_2.002854_3_plen_436_part_00
MPKRRRRRSAIVVEESDLDTPDAQITAAATATTTATARHRSEEPALLATQAAPPPCCSEGEVEVTHDGVFCDGCAAEEPEEPEDAAADDWEPIRGVRYTRGPSVDYDLCGSCYAQLCDEEKRRYRAIHTPVTRARDTPLQGASSDDESEEPAADEDAVSRPGAAPASGGSSLTHGEMPVQAAQRTAAVRVSGALSSEEVKQLLTAHAALRRTCGVLRTQSGGDSVEGRGNWGTTYLHTDGNFATMFPHIRQKIFDLAASVDCEQGWNLLTSPPSLPQLRCVELHTVGPGGSLPEQTHYDHGSLITVDILLSNVSDAGATGVADKDFEGGNFCTLECDGELSRHTSFQHGGDALVFVSHKYHCVQPVLSGRRQVLVAELWAGIERQCAHRCEHHEGECPVNLALSRSAEVSFLEYLSRFPHDPSNLLDRYPDGVMT